MKRVITRLSVLALFAFAAYAQTVPPAPPTVTSLFGSLGNFINPDTPIPAHGLFVFGGNQGENLIGGFSICATASTLNLICANTSHVGATTAETIEGQQILIAQHGFVGFINGDAGIATGANGGTGFAAQYGGGGAYNISRLPFLKPHPGYWLGVRAGWDKRDVYDLVAASSTVAGAKAALVPFAKKTSVQFFFGKTW